MLICNHGPDQVISDYDHALYDILFFRALSSSIYSYRVLEGGYMDAYLVELDADTSRPENMICPDLIRRKQMVHLKIKSQYR